MTSPTPGQPPTALPVLAPCEESRAALAALARDWIADCQWDDLDGEDVPGLTDDEALAAIARHYDGGLPAFTLDCQPRAAAPRQTPLPRHPLRGNLPWTPAPARAPRS
jgi:hypothetical protein